MRETLEQRALKLSQEMWKGERIDNPWEFTGKVSAAFARKLLEEARPYIQHKVGCRQGTDFCECHHADTQHFLKQKNKPCAHCDCKEFRQSCSCGLAELLEGLKMSEWKFDKDKTIDIPQYSKPITERPEKWKGLERIGGKLMTIATLYGLHSQKGIRPFLREEFGPLLDAAEAQLEIVVGPEIVRLRQELEKFR